MRLSDEGGRCADKIGRRVARIVIADLDRVGRFFLHQPADQRLSGCLRTAPGRRMSDSVVVVEVGTRGRAGRVHTATRWCLVHTSLEACEGVATMEVATETSGVAAERTILFGQETTVDLTQWACAARGRPQHVVET